jgi:glycosyltransferase involved in cell wall biosynthesis
LQSVSALRAAADEVLVLDCSTDGRPSRAVSGDYPVRYVAIPGTGLTQARNRGITTAVSELVAFIEDDCHVEADWLAQIDESFADPALAAVAGYVGPMELETRGQWLFDFREAPRRRFDRERLAGTHGGWCGVSYRNAICRRSALLEAGLFAAELGPGTHARSGHEMDLTYRLMTSGYSILVDPGRIAWHRHPESVEALERALVADLFGGFAAAGRCMVAYRDPLASVAMIGSTASAVLAAAACAESRERGSARRVLGGVLRRAAGERGILLRALRQRRDEHRTPHVVSAATPHVGTAAAVRREGPPLTVVVPSYNRRQSLHEVLVALSRQSYPSQLFEVVVVIDGSTDGSAELARSLETPYELRVLAQENRGLAASRNRGTREAREDLLVFLDDDLTPESQFLAAHVADHQPAHRADVVLGSCPPVAHDGSLWSNYFRGIWNLHYRCKAQPHHRWTYADIVGGNCSLRRSLVLESGGWDERFARREDWELGVRLLKRGVAPRYRPEARAWHHFESTLATELLKRQVEGRDDVYFASKHPHLKAQLPLAAYARVGDSTRGRLVFRYGRAGERAVRAAVPLANGLEALHLRRRWLRLVDSLLSHAYLLGLAETLGSLDRLTEFLAPVASADLVEIHEVALRREGCLQVPPTVGALDLLIRSSLAPPVRIRALDLEGQWDWEAIEQRLLEEVGGSLIEG